MPALSETLGDNLPEIQSRLTNWWDHGPQDRPLLLITTDSLPLPELAGDDLEKWWTDVPAALEWRMRNLEQQHYFGAAVPCHYIDLGASAMPAVMGCPMEYVNADTIWAHPVCDDLDEALAFPLETGNRHHAILRALTEGSLARAPGHHFVTPWALGGVTDNAAALYGTENLLMDMLEEPEKVARLLERMADFWIVCWEEFQGLLKASATRSGIGWCGVWAPGSTFPLQEDFSYMISSDLFREFCVPRITRLARAMDYPMYHLDGAAALKHLDAILAIPEIKAVQWQPGAGRERLAPWEDVIRTILQSGKSLQLYAAPDEIPWLDKTFDPRGLAAIILGADRDQARELTRT